MSNPFSRHYWRNRFSRTYLWLGLGGFLFLPTQTSAEWAARSVFIIMGMLLLLSSFLDNRKFAIIILSIGAGVTTLWLFVGTAMIILDYSQPIYRIHFFYMPLWFLLAEEHYKAIKGLQAGE